MEGQINIFDVLPELDIKARTMNDWWKAETLGKEFQFKEWELVEWQKRVGKSRSLSFWFAVDVPKCCNCYPLLRQTKHNFSPKSYLQCLVCGKKTEPCDDYSWIETKNRWRDLFGVERVYPKCSHSGHVCNKKELHKVAQEFDDIECPQICCRLCQQKLCGARCNGADKEKGEKHLS